jgi:hypothetical protein
VNIDMALMKETRITESVQLQFRTEVFNVFNHANFSLPAASIFTASGRNATAGQITQAHARTANSVRFEIDLLALKENGGWSLTARPFKDNAAVAYFAGGSFSIRSGSRLFSSQTSSKISQSLRRCISHGPADHGFVKIFGSSVISS